MMTLHLDQNSLDEFLKLSASVTGDSDSPDSAPNPTVYNHEETDAEQEEIRALLGRTDAGLRRDAAWVLLQPVRLAALVARASVEQYCDLSEVVECLRADTAHTFIVSLSDHAAWTRALTIARRRRQRLPHNLHDIGPFSREHAVAAALKRLGGQGYPWRLTTYGVSFADATLDAITNQIDHLVAQVGGRVVADGMLTLLVRMNRVFQGAFLAGRTVDMASRKPRQPGIPVHYLYNLGLKHLNAQPGSRQPQQDFTAAIELARDLGAALDVETYSAFTNINISSAAVHRKILDNVLFDELFAFQKWVPTVADKLLTGWIRRLEEQNCIPSVATADQFISLGTNLLARAHVARLEVVHAAELVTPNVSTELAHRLCQRLSSKSGELNTGYMTPFDTAKRNSPYFPLYAYPSDLFLIPPKCIIARAFCERVFTLIRDEKIADYENKMGKALELLTCDVLSMTGNPPEKVGGWYRSQTQRPTDAPLELDVAVGSGTHLVLMECKSKALTNASRRGDSMGALLDFSRGFLYPLRQSMNHERLLLSTGEIEFLDKTKLLLQGRRIERIMINLTDHGSMQDRTFLSGIVRALWGGSLSSGDPKRQWEADEVSGEIAAVVKGIDDLAKSSGVTLQDFFQTYIMSTWWLSVDQLALVCSIRPNLWEGLLSVRHVTFQTGDFLSELAARDRMGKRNPEPVNGTNK